MLWGIRVDDGDGGCNFLAVSAETVEQAVGVVRQLEIGDVEEAVPLEEIIEGQYKGIAVLSTMT